MERLPKEGYAFFKRNRNADVLWGMKFLGWLVMGWSGKGVLWELTSRANRNMW
jgi:hypothetical protein